MPAISSTSSVLTLPTVELALVGINTPLSGLSVAGGDANTVAVVISARVGTLYADVSPGAIVSGGGSSSLWISGSPADVSAKLATLVYAASAPGLDTLTVTLVDTAGPAVPPSFLPVGVLPLITPNAPPLTITGGTLTLDTKSVDGLTLDLHDAQTGAGAATIVLIDTVLGANTTLDVATTGAAPRVAIAGQVTWNGAATFHEGAALVTLARRAALTNSGRITFDHSSAQLTGAGTLRNDGVIAVTGASGPQIDVAVAGSGVISLAAGASLGLGAAVSSSETIRFESNTGVLKLDAPDSMQATIADFRPGDQIELGVAHIDAADYTQDGAAGTLTLYNGGTVAARLHIAGPHQLGDFRLSVATDTDAGTITTLSVLAPTPVTGGADAYRFFDNAHGSQLLTQDAGERDTIIATRPDLVYEGAAFRAVADAASDPAAVAVYRFFDTTHGTHFLTSDLSEKTTLLASRPDLVLEQNSTMWEHATQQAGDVPVFRFFDTATGAHFYTDSAGERASILTTRSDLRAEGVAFYAPDQ